MSTARVLSKDVAAKIRWGVVLIAVVVALWFPQYFAIYHVDQATRAIAVAVAVLGLNLLTGFTGQISLGHTAFFGIGAYSVALLESKAGWSHAGGAMAGMLLAFLVGIICGLPALRIKKYYLAVVTLALAALFPQLLIRFSDFTGGVQGLHSARLRAPEWAAGLGIADDQFRYYAVLLTAIIVFLLARNLTSRRIGRALRAVHDNAVVGEVAGVDVRYYQVMMFGISGACTALGGALFVMQSGFVSAADGYIQIFGVFMLVAAMVIGGSGTIIGAAIGAAFIQYVPNQLASIDAGLAHAMFGVVLIAVMFVAPSGIAGAVGGAVRRMSERKKAPPSSEALVPIEESEENEK